MADEGHVGIADTRFDGGTYRLLDRVLGAWGVDVTAVEMSDADAVRAAIRPGATKVLWVETPRNPLLKITDIAALADIAHAGGALLAVDNCFCTPALQRPSNDVGIDGLALAGDYTAGDYPATLESAVRSGMAAATLVARR